MKMYISNRTFMRVDFKRRDRPVLDYFMNDYLCIFTTGCKSKIFSAGYYFDTVNVIGVPSSGGDFFGFFSYTDKTKYFKIFHY